MIVILEDDERRTTAMKQELEDKFPNMAYQFFDNAPEMIEWLKENMSSVKLMSLDHDLGASRDKEGERFEPGIGRDVVDFLITQKERFPLILHTTNIEAGYGMKFALEEVEWRNEWIKPFNDLEWIELEWSRKINAIKLNG